MWPWKMAGCEDRCLPEIAEQFSVNWRASKDTLMIMHLEILASSSRTSSHQGGADGSAAQGGPAQEYMGLSSPGRAGS